MNPTSYNPEIHHRHSIRLKGHDYAGGGLYFVTICGHRDAGMKNSELRIVNVELRIENGELRILDCE